MIGLTWSSTKERTVSRTSFSSSERSASKSRKSTPGKRLKGDPPDAGRVRTGVVTRLDAAIANDSRPPAAAGAAEASPDRPADWFRRSEITAPREDFETSLNES